ncbi:hypothetical protein IGI37_000319 [Enterococcus sp. AZ194]
MELSLDKLEFLWKVKGEEQKRNEETSHLVRNRKMRNKKVPRGERETFLSSFTLTNHLTYTEVLGEFLRVKHELNN